MISHGYISMYKSDKRVGFNKGYTADGYADRVFHIHLHLPGDNDEILFRDYLRAHPDIAKEYEDIKLGLLPKFRNNRDSYTAAKTQFIQRVLSLARDEDNR